MGKREILANALERTGTGQLLSATVAQWSGLVVFNYHRIGDPVTSLDDHCLFSATADEFEQQVRFLKNNYNVVRTTDIHRVLSEPSTPAVMITFDDGYLDNYELAFPILKQCDVSALFFITSGFLDDGTVAWWDEISWMVRSSSLQSLHFQNAGLNQQPIESGVEKDSAIQSILRAIKSLPESQFDAFLNELSNATQTERRGRLQPGEQWMTWDMIREMDQSGMEIGGHTVTHPILANCDPERQFNEISESKLRIETELGHSINAFSYPVGQTNSFTEETKAMLSLSGYEWGFSFYGGYSHGPCIDPYDLKRMPVTGQLDKNLFRSIARLPQIFARK